MKKYYFLLLMFAGIFISLACSDNTTPTKPPAPPSNNFGTTTATVVTFTPTGTAPSPTNTPTSTPTGVLNTPTPTYSPTTTWTSLPTPQFQHNYGTSAAPTGMYYDGAATLYVAEAENKAGTIVNGLEEFVWSGGGVLTYNGTGNCIALGQATPCPTYQPTPYIFSCSTVHYPVGVAVSSPFGTVPWGVNSYPGEVEILDVQASGAASLLVENNYVYCPPALDGGPFMNFTTGFGGAVFNNPKCLTADSFGNFYVADTGNGYVDEFDGGGYLFGNSPAWLHRWNGYANSATLISPVAMACDTAGNIFVGDKRTNYSEVQVYGSGGTTLLGVFDLIPGCQINGITVDSLGDFYVSDTNNGEVEEYQMIGWSTSPPIGPPNGVVLNQAPLIRVWGDPHSYHEFLPYMPGCLQFIGSYVVVSDSGNDFLNVFGP